MTLSQLIDQIAQQDTLEWIGLITGIVYIILATYERPSCWIFGILSSACIAWKSYTDYQLLADTALQIFYVGMGILGLIYWYKGSTEIGKKVIITSPWIKHLQAVIICLVLSWPLSWLLINFTDARYGFVDTLLTCLSVWATILLIRKDLHNWIYWIVIDAVYVILYLKTDGYLFALLFLIYAIISIYGLKRWTDSKNQERAVSEKITLTDEL